MKPKAPRWLTESFAQGVDERERELFFEGEEWSTNHPLCWLAQFDPAHKPCEGKLERFHFVRRQTVESAVGNLLPTPAVGSPIRNDEEYWPVEYWRAVVLNAAWDPRNGGIACEAHHRRLDSQLVPLPSEQLIVPFEALPEHVLEFSSDYGLEEQLEAKYEPSSMKTERKGE